MKIHYNKFNELRVAEDHPNISFAIKIDNGPGVKDEIKYAKTYDNALNVVKRAFEKDSFRVPFGARISFRTAPARRGYSPNWQVFAYIENDERIAIMEKHKEAKRARSIEREAARKAKEAEEHPVEQGLEIQKKQIEIWKTKLNAEVFADLLDWIAAENAKLSDVEHASLYNVTRGTSIDCFIANWKPKHVSKGGD